MLIDNAGGVGFGHLITDTLAAKLCSLATTEQLRLEYDVSNYMSFTVAAAGSTTFALTGTAPVFTFSQSVGMGITPTAVLHLKAGTATASTAPLKFTAGTVTTAPEAGAVEFDGTDYWVTV